MDRPYRAAALSILARLRRLADATVTYRPARESEFPHLDFRAYRKVEGALVAAGFRCFGDVEPMEASLAPNPLFAATVLRGYTSADATLVAVHYQLRPLWATRVRLLLFGTLSLRWIAAPRSFARNLATRNCIDLMTELDDGSFIGTSNAWSKSRLTRPPLLDGEWHPYGTPIATLLARQRERVAARLKRTPGVRPRRHATPASALAMMARIADLRAAWRRSIGLVTREELRAMSSGGPGLPDAVFDEIQAILREEAGAQDPAGTTPAG